jgi:hypothetical protein
MPIGHPDTALELARALLIWEDQRQRDAERGHVQRPCRFEAEQEPASQAKAAGCRAIGATVVLLSGRTKTTTERDVLWTRGTTRRATDDA